MKYTFDQKHGQLQDGYTVLRIIDGQADVESDAERALAERYGGKPATFADTKAGDRPGDTVRKIKTESAKAADKPRGESADGN